MNLVKAARLMLENRISGLPVVDAEGKLIGVVTEGDFLRRGEIDTQRHRPQWLEFIIGPGRLAEEYVHTAWRKVDEIMTADPCTVVENDSLEKVVDLMERHRVKRLPVMRAGRMVGIVSRANLMRGLVSLVRDALPSTPADLTIRDQILTTIGKQHWAPHLTSSTRTGLRNCGALLWTNANARGSSS
jgi:CBS domain-containing protein